MSFCDVCALGPFKDIKRHCKTRKHNNAVVLAKEEENAVALAKEEEFCCDICETGPLTKYKYNRHCESQKHKDAEIIFERGQSKDACEMPDSDGEESQIILNSKRLRDSGSHDESDDAADVADTLEVMTFLMMTLITLLTLEVMIWQKTMLQMKIVRTTLPMRVTLMTLTSKMKTLKTKMV
jgi:hypothetical protein